MLILALSDAATTTIVFIFLWAILFPALVTGLLALAFYGVFTEHRENRESRRYPRP